MRFLTLIPLGKVKVDLDDFDVKLRKKTSYEQHFKKYLFS